MKYIWAGFGCLVGLAIGWWAGSFTACALTEDGCEVRVQAIEALGTWVGGVGTILAVGAAILAFRSEERSRRSSERREANAKLQQSRQALENATRIVVTAKLVSYTGDDITEIVFEISNGASEVSAFDLTLTHDEYGPFPREHSLDPGRTVTRPVQFGGRHNRIVPRVPSMQRDEWLRQQLSGAKLKFKMSDVEWLREGDAQPTEV